MAAFPDDQTIQGDGRRFRMVICLGYGTYDTVCGVA
jgi:hypothetical protein